MTYAQPSDSSPNRSHLAGHTTFPSPLGVVELAWTDAGVRSLRWGDGPAPPEAGERPAWIQALIQRVQRHLEGKPDPLRDVPVDDRGWSPFDRAVLVALREVGPGERVTYGELAKRAGSPKAARAVGGALGRNPVPLIVPCHRVVKSDGSLGGFSASGGPPTKARLLALEEVA